MNDTVTIHRLISNGAGVGVLSGFICAPDLREGRLVRLLPDWNIAALEVSLVFPSGRALSKAVRVFIDFLKASPDMGKLWNRDMADAVGSAQYQNLLMGSKMGAVDQPVPGGDEDQWKRRGLPPA